MSPVCSSLSSSFVYLYKYRRKGIHIYANKQMFMHIFAWEGPSRPPQRGGKPCGMEPLPTSPKGRETMRMGISVVGTESCLCPQPVRAFVCNGYYMETAIRVFAEGKYVVSKALAGCGQRQDSVPTRFVPRKSGLRVLQIRLSCPAIPARDVSGGLLRAARNGVIWLM